MVRKDAKQAREQVWFRRWITEGYSVRQLRQQSGHSRDKLYRIIYYGLSRDPGRPETEMNKYSHLIFDGTFLHRPAGLVAVMDVVSKKVIAGQYGVSENSEQQLRSFFQPLIAKGLNPKSCTVDGNPQAIRVLRDLWPKVVIQRCLVHIQRQGLSWCRQYPKTVYARKLRDIFLKVPSIRSREKQHDLIDLITNWEQQYGSYIDIKPEKGTVVFSDIKRARSMLLKALPNMFHYLDDPCICFTTNGLEGYFSRMKSHYRQHRGLSKKKLDSYFNWYFYLKPK